jgi:AraC-like DNA-binding protein
VFETYQKSELVPLQFNDLVVTSMLRGKKVMHLFENDVFDYLPGQSVIIPSNVEMRIDFPEASFENPTQCLALAIDHKKIVDTLHFLNERYPKAEHSNYWALDDTNYFFQNDNGMAEVINKIIAVCQSDSIFKDALADLALQELLVKIVQSQTLKGIASNNTSIKSHVLKHLVESIRHNIAQRIDLKHLASTAGMSMSGLYRLFKAEMGISPLEFVMLEKIKLAKKYLMNKDVYVKNVAFEAGFEDSNYFIRLFKHYEGVTPKQYQLMMQQSTQSGLNRTASS